MAVPALCTSTATSSRVLACRGRSSGQDVLAGTWGTGWFDNDAAADLVGDVEDAKPSARAGLIAARPRTIAGQGGYIEGPEADEGLAAAALVTVAGGATTGVAKKVEVARTPPDA